jgi:hypothetical protein
MKSFVTFVLGGALLCPVAMIIPGLYPQFIYRGFLRVAGFWQIELLVGLVFLLLSLVWVTLSDNWNPLPSKYLLSERAQKVLIFVLTVVLSAGVVKLALPLVGFWSAGEERSLQTNVATISVPYLRDRRLDLCGMEVRTEYDPGFFSRVCVYHPRGTPLPLRPGSPVLLQGLWSPGFGLFVRSIRW